MISVNGTKYDGPNGAVWNRYRVHEDGAVYFTMMEHSIVAERWWAVINSLSEISTEDRPLILNALAQYGRDDIGE